MWILESFRDFREKVVVLVLIDLYYFVTISSVHLTEYCFNCTKGMGRVKIRDGWGNCYKNIQIRVPAAV